MNLIREIDERYPQLVEWCRDFHQHGHHESRTLANVAGHLRSLGLEKQERVGGYGVIGRLRGGSIWLGRHLLLNSWTAGNKQEVNL